MNNDGDNVAQPCSPESRGGAAPESVQMVFGGGNRHGAIDMGGCTRASGTLRLMEAARALPTPEDACVRKSTQATRARGRESYSARSRDATLAVMCWARGGQWAPERGYGVSRQGALSPPRAQAAAVGRYGALVSLGDWDERYTSHRDGLWSGRANGVLVAEVARSSPGHALDIGCGEGADAILDRPKPARIARGTRQPRVNSTLCRFAWTTSHSPPVVERRRGAGALGRAGHTRSLRASRRWDSHL